MTNVVAFLQNAWFKNPERIRAIFDLHKDDLGRQAKLHATYLFYGCLTGRRIYKAFGEGDEIRHDIIWENANPGFVDQSSGKLPADPAHIRKIIDHFKPSIILTFGTIATNGVVPICMVEYPSVKLISGPHPAARHKTVVQELAEMAKQLQEARNGLDTSQKS